MVLLLTSFYEFTLFLKIVLWIAVPLILISFTVTTLLHYRQKKKNALKVVDDPELPVNQVVDISLVSRLQREVVHYKKRIRELQHALSFAKEVITPAALNSKVASLQKEVEILTSDSLLTVDDNPSADVVTVPFLTAEPGVGGGSFNGRAELASGGSNHGAVEEISIEAIPGTSAVSSNVGTIEGDSTASAAYLQDLVQEQKTHVLFLQQQLESRIKAFHELEYQFRDNAALLEKMTLSYQHTKHQLDDSIAAAETANEEKEALRLQLTRLEASLRELQDQHNQSLRLLDTTTVTPAAGKITARS